MGAMFRAFNQESRTNWERLVPAMMLAINSSVNRVTGFLPIFLMTGRPPKVRENNYFQEGRRWYWHYERQMRFRWKNGMGIWKVIENVGKNLQYRTKWYLQDDSKGFEEGVLVLVFWYTKGNPNQARTITLAWSLPLEIIEKNIYQ